jgi:N-acetylneuraminate synthase
LSRPFYVAEISANHLNDKSRAISLIEAASSAGASAVKFQTYTPETMTLPINSFRISSNHTLWGGIKLYDLYAEAMTPWEWHSELFDVAKHFNVVPFSSPFDRSAVDFLEQLNCPIYKIASMETGDVDLIFYAAQTKKPLIISTGASTLEEIDDAFQAAVDGGASKISLLVCTSSYPATPRDAHLSRISTLRQRYNVPIGISDHTLGIGVSLAAIGMGAAIIEKHFTLRREDGGHDSSFSMEPEEFAQLVTEGNDASDAIGSGEWASQDSESESRSLRRSLIISKDVKKGDFVNRENVKPLRPNLGATIKNYDLILGKRFINDFSAGMPATPDCVE